MIIQTRYKGYRTRSRLEARWMVYMDAVGLRYEYEPEGFDLGEAGLYLPDFWLPDVQSWAEVKPEALNPDEVRRCSALVLETQKDCVLLVGTPEAKPYETLELFGYADESGPHRHREMDGLNPKVGVCDAYIDASYVSERRFFVCTGGETETSDPFIRAAVQAARSARFEHGERGNYR